VGYNRCNIRSQGITPASPLLILKIHVDNYRYELFGSIKSPETWAWGPFLLGHADKCDRLPGVADRIYEGYLTRNPNTTFHSCDSRGSCPVRDNANVVQIIPVTNHDFSTDHDAIPSPLAEVVRAKSNSPIPSSDSKRKSEVSSQSPKRTKETALKEPGHTLLAQSWWVRAGKITRPPLVASSGEALSYYIVPLRFKRRSR